MCLQESPSVCLNEQEETGNKPVDMMAVDMVHRPGDRWFGKKMEYPCDQVQGSFGWIWDKPWIKDAKCRLDIAVELNESRGNIKQVAYDISQ